jgi:FlaA1/EpsC-like NDP-sugar epimerase
MKNKTILITGGTGTLGKHLVKQILKKKPKKVIIYSRHEDLQVKMRREYENKKGIRFFIGDVRDRDRLETAFRGVDWVIHCAALKHVDVCEYNSDEAVETNIEGVRNVIKAAIHQNVKKVLNISSDKAVNPINNYGSTKHVAEKLIRGAVFYAGKNGTQFASIRFGNFWGSRGSVVPYFEQLKQENAEFLPIHSYEMTRFFIQPEEAVKRIVEALKIMQGGEIFCPKMESVTIKDVAKRIAPNMETREVGAKMGEKIHEEMLTSAEVLHTYFYKNLYIINPSGNGMGKKVSEHFVYSSEML